MSVFIALVFAVLISGAILYVLYYLHQQQKPGTAVKLIVQFGPKGTNAMTVQINNDSKGMTGTLTAVDNEGQPAKVVGVPAWSVDQSSLLTLTPAADGMTCQVVPTGTSGVANITVTAEGDPTPGVDHLSVTIPVNIVTPEASQLNVSFSTPT